MTKATAPKRAGYWEEANMAKQYPSNRAHPGRSPQDGNRHRAQARARAADAGRRPLMVVLAALAALALVAALAGCVGPEPRYAVRERPEPAKLPSSTVYFYPKKGQDKQQQDRDRYACYLWAVKQSGYDPGNVQPPAGHKVDVVPTVPPGHDTAAGAFTGAVIGSMVTRPRHAGEGMIIGAITGAAIGASSDEARRQRTEEVQRQYDERAAAERSALVRKINDYRRAMGACLEGRGYSVR